MNFIEMKKILGVFLLDLLLVLTWGGATEQTN